MARLVTVRVKPGVSTPFIREIDQTHFEVGVRARAHEGAATEATIRALARYLKLPPTRLSVRRGHTARIKQIEII